MIKSLDIVTDGNMRSMRGTTLWNMLQSGWKGTPFFFLYMILLEIFKHEDTGAPLDTGLLSIYIVALVICLVLQFFVSNHALRKAYIGAYNMVAEVRIRLGEHLRKLPMGFFKRTDPGDSTSLLLHDVDRVEETFSRLYPDLIGAIVLPAVMAVFLALADWRLCLVLVITALVAVPALVICLRILKHFSIKQMTAKGKMTSRTLEYLHGMKTIKAYNQTGTSFTRLDDANKEFRKECIKLEAAPVPLIMLYQCIIELGFILVIMIGTNYVLGNTLSPTVFLLFLVIGYQFCEPLKQISVYISEMRYMNVAADRISDVLETKPLPEPEEDVELDKFDIEFKDVSFAYDTKTVLNDINIKMPENTVTALVGPSGSGKTTITNLIARFWDVSEGSIMIGGRDVREVKTDRLLSYISAVFQDVYLFNDTIYNNIRIGKNGATEEEIRKAAEAAQCLEFIEKLPNGFDTVIGEGGSTLSGGEKQRISIARAILKDAPIILLDEATASLDPENEKSIQNAIHELVKSKTVVVIAHRLNTISASDQIVVLKEGSIVEKGRHKELLEQGGLYAHMWSEQEKARGWKITENKDPGAESTAA